jgi:uncharacterized protein with von Willebrand factor type A (vWA) domain
MESDQAFDRNELEAQVRAINEDFVLLEPFQKMVMQATSLDLLLIMDTTGSMSMWIEECKNKIKGIIADVRREFP